MPGIILWLRKGFVIFVAITLATISGARAQTYPARYITLVVPIAAGGPPDLYARLVANGLSDALRQQVIIENRPGAGLPLQRRQSRALLLMATRSCSRKSRLWPLRTCLQT